MITKEQIKELSKSKRINQDTILREYLQILFLKILYGEKLSQKIYFKGGTAIHLLLGSSRFSMDLVPASAGIVQKYIQILLVNY